jgi:site-specific recombinase XerD
LAPFAPGFREELIGRGYRPWPTVKQLQLLAHVSRWLEARDLQAGELTVDRVEQFVRVRRASRRSGLVSTRAMRPLLGYLRGLGVIPEAAMVVLPLPGEQLVARYSAYLLERRGLSQSSVRNYVNVARAFFSDRETLGGSLALEELDGPAVTDFVLRESRRTSIGSAMCLVVRLRALLRFLHVEGEIAEDLTGAVPRVASWRNASLVKALDSSAVTRLLASCDRRTRFGRRDFAVLMLLCRLGLRGGEVAAMRLADIDWRGGEVMIRGKGSRQEQLPLPTDVGEALAGWLRHGRPRCESPFVFTHVRAPHEGLSPTAVTGIVRRACERAGLPVVGAHRLRHTAATEMLRAGVSLSAVGQVLRHRDADTTAIYAKVDRLALAAVVQPWPGSSS